MLYPRATSAYTAPTDSPAQTVVMPAGRGRHLSPRSPPGYPARARDPTPGSAAVGMTDAAYTSARGFGAAGPPAARGGGRPAPPARAGREPRRWIRKWVRRTGRWSGRRPG